jgi:hypothetical protein
LTFCPDARVQPGVIRKSRQAFFLQPACDLIGSIPRSDIDNTRFAGMFAINKIVELLFVLIFEQDTVRDIRTIKAGDKLGGLS